MTTEERFMEFVEPVPESGCWIWMGNTNTERGEITYGRFSNGGKYWLAHRFSYHLFNGEIPEDKFVLHKCDVRCCVNPEHLFIGDQKDNMQDMINKGRFGKRNVPSGEKNTFAKLSNYQVQSIRALFSFGAKLGELAEFYNVSKAQICRIVNNKSRKNG